MKPWHQMRVWDEVAIELRDLRKQGLARLLTEETVRFATVKALVRSGVAADTLRYEWPHPALPGSRIDLVVGIPPTVLIEVKYPREPNDKNAPWTMIYGGVLKDFYRLAAYSYEADRIFVYAESAQLGKFMAGAAAKYGLDIGSDQIALHPNRAADMPATVAAAFGPTLATKAVTAHRIAAIDVDPTLALHVYSVDPFDIATPMVTSLPNPRTTASIAAPASRTTFGSPRASGVRGEILAAIDAIVTRSGRSTFELSDVLVEMRRRGSGYAESTVRTMVTSHMCANAPDHSATTYPDLERIGRGVYQRRTVR
jgi:hypothetical protein